MRKSLAGFCVVTLAAFSLFAKSDCDVSSEARLPEISPEIKSSRPALTAKVDFDVFWAKAKARVDAHEQKPIYRLDTDVPYTLLRVYDVTIPGLDGTPVKGWLLLPRDASPSNRVACVVQFHGGGGSRYLDLKWACSGLALLMADFRHQGGVTGSATAFERMCGNAVIGFNLKKMPEDYYLYHAWTDQLLALRAAFEHPCIDPERVAVCGQSQGGGTALMAAALEPRVKKCFAAVPSYCWWERRIDRKLASAAELESYLRDRPADVQQVFDLMSYFDGMNFAPRIKCPVRLYACGRDTAVPPECVYAVYNHLGTSDKRIVDFPYGRHECYSGQYFKWIKELQGEWGLPR